MNYMDTKDSTIFYLKFLQALMVCDNIPDFLKEAEELELNYTSLALLETFRDIINAYTSSWSLLSNITRNIFDYISFCRYQSDEETKEETKKRYALCNDIINALNTSKDKEEYPFYPNLINKIYRNFIPRMINHAAYASNPSGMQEFLNSFLIIEYYVLYSHSHLLEDTEFMAFGCSFLLNGTYLEAIDFLLDEIPELASDTIFLKRIRKILTENENLLSEYEGKPVPGSDSYLEDDDEQYVSDKSFWKLHNKVKKKIVRYQKDS